MRIFESLRSEAARLPILVRSCWSRRNLPMLAILPLPASAGVSVEAARRPRPSTRAAGPGWRVAAGGAADSSAALRIDCTASLTLTRGALTAAPESLMPRLSANSLSSASSVILKSPPPCWAAGAGGGGAAAAGGGGGGADARGGGGGVCGGGAGACWLAALTALTESLTPRFSEKSLSIALSSRLLNNPPPVS